MCKQGAPEYMFVSGPILEPCPSPTYWKIKFKIQCSTDPLPAADGATPHGVAWYKFDPV